MLQTYKNPPETIKIVMEAVCVILDVKPAKIRDMASTKVRKERQKKKRKEKRKNRIEKEKARVYFLDSKEVLTSGIWRLLGSLENVAGGLGRSAATAEGLRQGQHIAKDYEGRKDVFLLFGRFCLFYLFIFLFFLLRLLFYIFFLLVSLMFSL